MRSSIIIAVTSALFVQAVPAAPPAASRAVLTDVPQFSGTPTGIPNGAPTGIPTGIHTGLPIGVPTGLPTSLPTAFPTAFPTAIPTGFPPIQIPSGIFPPGGAVPTGFPHFPCFPKPSGTTGGFGHHETDFQAIMEKAKEMIEKFKKAFEDGEINLPDIPSGVISAPSAGTTGSLAARQIDNATVEELVAKAQEWIKKLMEMLNQGSGIIPSASVAAPVATSA
ncbi:hypothetical protein BZA77DRAFT_84256 [Pyronema omphalodes]|nr:hypothetical protein BZA77DRAFT_84256 [Pyronema omphalodes]